MATYSKDPEHNIVQLERWKRMILALPTIRWKGSVPWGYDEVAPGIIHPIDEELEYLAEAMVHLKKYSYAKIADWLYAKTGRRIGYQGIYDIARMRPLDPRITRLVDGRLRLIPIAERFRLLRESSIAQGEEAAYEHSQESSDGAESKSNQISQEERVPEERTQVSEA